MASASPVPVRPAAVVRLEVRVGSGRSTVYEVGDGGFLIGSVAGCDLRLPGANLPPVVCLIARQPSGASLRKLAPIQPIAVNGRPVSSTYLADGDQVSVGVAEFIVHLSVAEDAVPAPSPLAQLEDRLRQIEAREETLRRAAELIEADRKTWFARREEIEAECGQQSELLDDLKSRVQQFSTSRSDLDAREKVCRQIQDEFTRKQADLEARLAEMTRQETEVANLRQELARHQENLGDRFFKRRDRLLAQHQSLRRAARKIQLRKRDADQRQATVEELERGWALKQEELAARAEQIQRERQLLDEQHGLLSSRQQESQRDFGTRLADLDTREKTVAAAQIALDQGQKQHQADLVRLDRIQAGIEQRQKQLEQHALEVDRKFEQLQRDTRDLEEQAAQLDEQHTRITSESERTATREKEIESKESQLEQRAATLEGQQTMLATLRTRLERMREDLHRQEQALSDQRVLQEAGEADLADRRAEAEKLRIDLDNDRQLFDQERRRFNEHRATLEQAVAQLRLTQETLAIEQAEVQMRAKEVETTAAEQAEQASLLLARGEQIEQLTQRIQSDRQALQERQTTLTKAEQMLAALQDHVRRRVEECETRTRDLDSRDARTQAQESQLAETSARTEAEFASRRAELDRLRNELATQAAAIEQRGIDIALLDRDLTKSSKELTQAQESFQSQRQALAAERVAWEVDREATVEHQRKARDEFEQARDEAQMLVRLLPDLELRAKTALQGMDRGREQLREHLGEIHGYSRQSREELEGARRHVQAELERVRQQDLELRIARDEHRLAVAAFRQQLIEWQGRVGEMRLILQTDSTQLEMRQADLELRAQQMEDISARLTEDALTLEQAKRQVAERRGEVDRHLIDMREWYRKKIRELAGVNVPPGEPGEGDVLPLPADNMQPAARPAGDRNPTHAVLTLDEDLEPADRELGEMLTSLDLIDADTRQALWSEARRQRRSLRQLLLAGGYLTLYQLALIEAGNLDGLVLGPVRVIDKLSSGPREAVYRVFDPRRNLEAILRHLAEAEMHDAVRPDEFRQRFLAASAVQHNLIAGVLEVLTVADRPAALVEWVDGIPAGDLPGQVSAPGVWYRLVSQAALALHVAHSAGLVHGNLDSGALVFTHQGILKLVGLGEPAWLRGGRDSDDSPRGDLFALGQLAAAWATPTATGKATKSRSLPDSLQAVLDRLQSTDPATSFGSAQELLNAVEAAGASLPAGTTAWDRLLRQVREQVSGTPRRQTA